LTDIEQNVFEVGFFDFNKRVNVKLRIIYIESELLLALISMFFLSINDINSIKFDILSNI